MRCKGMLMEAVNMFGGNGYNVQFGVGPGFLFHNQEVLLYKDKKIIKLLMQSN